MIKSYYLTKKNIIVRDEANKKFVYELNRQNIMNVIADLDKQIDDVDKIIDAEDNQYRILTNKVATATLIQFMLTALVFVGFINASYITMLVGIIASFMVLTYTFGITFIGASKIRASKRIYRIFEGRELLVKTYNKLLAKSNMDGELVDVY